MRISNKIERSILFSDLWIEFSLIFVSFFFVRCAWGFIDGFIQGVRQYPMHP